MGLDVDTGDRHSYFRRIDRQSDADRESRDAKAVLEEELARARHAMEGMTPPYTRDAVERQFQEETADLEGRLWATDEV